MKKKKILLAAGAGSALLAVTLAAAPPLLLSSDWVRQTVLSRLNHGSIPGELAAEHCSVTWRRGLGCSGVVYQDAKQGFRLELAQLRSSQGLWPLLTAPKELGEIILDRPVLELTAAAEPEVPAAAAASGPPDKKERPAEQAAQPAPAAGKKTTEDSARLRELLNTLQGRLTVQQAAVRVVRPGQQPELFLRNGFLKAATAEGKVSFELTADSGQEGGAKLSGTARLTDILQGGMAGTDLRLHLAKVQVKPFLALKPGADGLPQGSGSLSADLRLEGAADGSMVLRGPLSLRDADLTGGPLGKDNPRFNQLALDLDLKKNSADWQFPALKAVSDFGNLELQCAYSGGGFKGAGSGKIDLSLLLAQFPRLLHVRDDLRLDKGELQLTAELSKENGILGLKAEAAADSLAGRQNGEAFAWEQPLRLELAGSLSGQEPEVEILRLSAPFLNVEGRGGRKQFFLEGTADLDQAMQEVNRLFRTGWDAGGRLELAAELTEQAAERYLVAAKAEIVGSRLVRQGQELLPSSTTSLNIRLDTPGQFPENGNEAAELTFDLSSWAGSLSGTFDGLHKKNEKISTGYQIETQLLLGRAVELLHKFGLLEPETSLGGRLDLRASGYTEDSRVVLRELDSSAKEFIFYQQGKVFRDPELRLATLPPETSAPAAEKTVRPLIEADSRSAFFADGGGFSLIDPASRRLNLRELEFSSSFAQIRLRQLALDDWQNKPMPVLRRLQVNGQSDLSKLAALLQQIGALAPDKKLGGSGTFAVELASQEEIGGAAAGKGSSGTVEIDLERFMYGKEGGLIAAKEKVEFRSKLHGDLAGGDMYFTTFDLLSPPLAVQSSGKLELAGKTPHLALEGTATPDLADLVALLNGMYPLGISAEGRQKEKFSLYYPFSGKQQQIDLKFASRVHADSLVRSGIRIEDLTADTSMKDGIMNAAFKGGLNGGVVQFTPKIDYTRTPPVLTLAGPEQVLDRVGLAETLADGLLKSFHPLLGAVARPAGTISVRAERLSLPIGGKGLEQADFSLRFDLASVLLEPVSALAGILELAGLNGQPLQLAEKTLVCEGKKGRISCSPIKMTVADSKMVLSGSAGFDGSLDYVLEVPVTKNLVGKKGYELLKGATFKVPIQGTKDKPAYNPEALRKAASSLLRQAAGHAAEQAVKEQVRKALPKELDKALPGLFDGLLGR
ncbi:hypothetical protein [Candidatus Electronema sp. JC]|uniref:hypothetical protein n=1 Tax=Candidatus Electronema sp. JC TaxID=3401570 RepID=UPI003AA89E07